jgi:nucleotide-binding universal stress UspA family protein
MLFTPSRRPVMLPIRTILHPTDLSDRSKVAFDLACSLARDYQAKIHVVHVVPQPVIGIWQGVVPPDPYRHQQEIAEKLHQLIATRPEVRAEHRLEVGEPVSETLRAAAEVKADLIVLGTHGWTGLPRLLMGSVAEGIMRGASCPVVTVRTPFPSVVETEKAAAEPRANVLQSAGN